MKTTEPVGRMFAVFTFSSVIILLLGIAALIVALPSYKTGEYKAFVTIEAVTAVVLAIALVTCAFFEKEAPAKRFLGWLALSLLLAGLVVLITVTRGFSQFFFLTPVLHFGCLIGSLESVYSGNSDNSDY